MRIFFDASAMTKRYVREISSERVLELYRRADEVVLSVICIPEVISGFNRLRREGYVTKNHYLELKTLVFTDCLHAVIVDVNTAVIDQAVSCLERNILRAMDAIHVASALVSGCDLFVSADKRQCAAARDMGISVEHA